MQAVCEFDNKDADVLAGGNEEFKQIVAGFGEILVEILHTGASSAKFGDATNEKGNIFTKGFFDSG